jgi:amino acid transporter
MNWEKLQQQLVREAREYLADLREMRDSLKSVEGWIVLGLIVATLFMAAAWAIVSLGFNPENDHVAAIIHTFGLRFCRPIDNFNGVILFVNLVMVAFLAVISLGNVFNMSKRVRQGLPREPRDLIVSASLLLLAGIGGIIFMLWIC